MLEINSLSFSYIKGEPVLSEISLKIDKYDSLALIGANGSGKTTLFLMLTGLYKFQGNIILNGGQLNLIEKKELRKKIGIVFQNADEQLFMPTVYEELELSLAQHFGVADEKKIDELLKIFNLEKIKYRKVEHLSAGEKKKTALASVLIYEPEILLLDEPTAFLDLKGCSELQRIINTLKITKIISTHNYLFAKDCCNKALLMKHGRAIAFDELSKVINNDLLLAEAEII